MDKLYYLIQYLLEESKEKINVPENINEKKKLYRALVNVRNPKEISDEFLKVIHLELFVSHLKKWFHIMIIGH